MPILTNPKHEAFCQARALGRTLEQAYEDAGFKASRQNAERLTTRDYIKARMLELQAATVARFEVTVESIAAELEEVRALSLQWKQPSAAVAAINTKAKLFGLISDRSVVNVTHNYAMMSEEEIRFELAALHAEALALKAGPQN